MSSGASSVGGPYGKAPPAVGKAPLKGGGKNHDPSQVMPKHPVKASPKASPLVMPKQPPQAPKAGGMNVDNVVQVGDIGGQNQINELQIAAIGYEIKLTPSEINNLNAESVFFIQLDLANINTDKFTESKHFNIIRYCEI